MTPAEPRDNLSTAQRALYEIRTLKAKIAELERAQKEPVAIVGLGVRFPGGASTPDSFWDLLSNGVDAITEIPSSRWPIDQYYNADPDAPGKMYARHGAFLGDPALFDADFFGISPREAMSLDPQHRLVLEVAWEALENAGRSPSSLAGSSSGVFLAASNSDYGRMVYRQAADIDAYSGIGNIFSVMAGRISYLLGLHGPSMVVDTACSGSLVALHLACQSLRARECHLALAGGVNLILSPEIHINFSKSRMMSQDGKCKTFDASADGYVRGEGCGMVVLKRLSDALADGDQVLSVVYSSAVNQDGHSSGLTAPNSIAQEALLRHALASAGIEPGEIDYIEAHGTGTSLGDPIEARALSAVFGSQHTSTKPLIAGSVKSNIGHLEAAAGVAGLIKVVLALQHEQIPPSLHFHKLNPHIEWGDTVQVPTEPHPWARGARRRLAGVSSFGFSGTNAHVILGDAQVPEKQQPKPERPLHIMTISARTDAALDTLVEQDAVELARTDASLADICYTANAGRAQFPVRTFYTGASKDDILRAPIARGRSEGVPEVVFLFPGQGAQYAGMGKELFDTQPVFRQAMEECAAHLAGKIETPLYEVLWGGATHLLPQTAYAQPALFAVEYSLARLWQSWGIEPAVVLGHSVGEYVAACIAGVYGLADGLKLIAARARLMQGAGGRGGMLAMQAGEAAARSAMVGLEQRVSLAAVNAPDSVVVSGYEEELGQVEQRLLQAGVRVKRLAVSHGFHSPQMAEIEEAWERKVAEVSFHKPQLEMISSVTGKAVRGEELSQASYWREQVRQPVRFAAAMEEVRAYGVFVEAGPGATLGGLGRQCLDQRERLWATSLRSGRGEWEQMLESLGQLYLRGAEVDWEGFDKPYDRRKVSLPTYPFQRQRYWLETKPIPATSGQSEWNSVCEAASYQSRHGSFDLRVAAYPGRWAVLDRLSQAFISEVLVRFGVFRTAGETHSAGSLVERCGIATSYRKLIHAWLARLGRDGVLRQEGDRFTAVQPLTAPDMARIRSEADAAFEGDRIFLDYVLRCGQNLANIVSGRTNPLETLFPGGDFTQAEDLYERAPLSAYFRAIGRSALEAFVRSRRQGDFRVLEVGAGTGSTASALLPVLPPNATEYHFTDVSESFLNYAKRKFAAYPFVRYAHLNIELDDVQAYNPGGFDVVAATNVLHATKDICATARHVKSLLAPGGILILCECTESFPWFDVTTALIEGWQRFEDGIRGEQPLLDQATWQSVLLDAGFETVSVFPEPGSPAEALGQRVFIAKAPGVGGSIRQAPIAIQPRTTEPPFQAALAEQPVLPVLLEAPPLQRHENLVSLMRQHIAAMLRFSSPDRVERKRRLTELGLDSLLALEFSSRVTKSLGLGQPLSSTLVFDHPTLDDLATYIESEVLHLTERPEASDRLTESLDARADELAQLPDEEVEAILLRKLQAI